MGILAGKTVHVQTGSRLHFGLLNCVDGRFGGCGVMVEAPGIQLAVRAARMSMVRGAVDDSIRNRVQRLLHQVSKRLELPRSDGFAVEIERCAPEHSGLGVGTQLSLAVARAVCELAARPADAELLANLAGRGKRSAVGVHGFLHGGFIVDDGKPAPEQLGRLRRRLEFPANWPVLLFDVPLAGRWHGIREEGVFERLQKSPAAAVAAQHAVRLSNLLESELTPAIEGQDYNRFAEALHEYNHRAGQCFLNEQAGDYADQALANFIGWLRASGIPAVGQSSWGPTVFAIAQDAETAQRIQHSAADTFDWVADRTVTTRARNTGADCNVAAA